MNSLRGLGRRDDRAGVLLLGLLVAALPSACAGESELAQLTATPTQDERQPAWSPDGRWIAFSASPAASDSAATPDLCLVSPNAGSMRRLTHDAFLESSPCWSPDGRSLAFHSWREDGVCRLWRLDLADSAIRQISQEKGRTTNPAWSPDGRTIAYYAIESGNEQVWKVALDGGAPVRLTHHFEQSWNPAWSPDGSEIAFSRYANATTGGAIFVMPADGDGESGERARPLTHGKEHLWDRFPSWSPNGRWVAFAAVDSAANWDIWLVSADGKIEVRITDDPAHDTEPSWAPDSRRLVFQSDRAGSEDLWILDTGRWTSAK